MIGLWVLVFILTVDVASAQTERNASEFQPNTTVAEKIWAENLKHRAEDGDVEAQFNLSQNYMDGHVFKQDFYETAKWLRASANQGHKRVGSLINEVVNPPKTYAVGSVNRPNQAVILQPQIYLALAALRE